MSLDGFFAGPDGDIEWFKVDEEFDEFATEQIETVTGLVFGRVTYELMAGYWPSEAASASEPVIAERMNSLPKLVFSRTLERADWANSRLVTGDVADAVADLKRRTDGDLYLFGSADLAATLTRAGLIDEYRLLVNPIVLGSGKPLFKGEERLHLRLVGTRTFGNGNVLLSYQTEGTYGS